MLQYAGALRDGHGMHTQLGFNEEWPAQLRVLAEFKKAFESGTFKELTRWGHPCIYREGFDWDLRRVGAFPCLYQINIDGRKVHKPRVLWDAGRGTYAHFLTDKTRQRITGYTSNENKKGNLVEFMCYFGAIGILASATSRGGI